MNYIVYKATSPSGKVYIGMTSKSLDARSKEHIWASKTNSKKRIFHGALQKYNYSFEWEILENNISKEDAEQLEVIYIKAYNSTCRDYGYNQAKGGMAGDIMSEESQQKWKATMRKYYDDPDYINKITSHLVNRKLTEKDYYKNQKKYITNYFKEIKNREKHSIIKGGKPFKCIQTNEIFISLSLASEKLGLYPQNIRKVLKKERKHTKGYTFEYIKENTNE